MDTPGAPRVSNSTNTPGSFGEKAREQQGVSAGTRSWGKPRINGGKRMRRSNKMRSNKMRSNKMRSNKMRSHKMRSHKTRGHKMRN